nr:hypothetical protein CFP56_57936 [Quercus suber]
MKDYIQAIQREGIKPMTTTALVSPSVTHEHQVTEREQIDRYYAKKHRLSLEQYRSKIASGALEQPSVGLGSIDPTKLADYRKRAESKGTDLETYVRRREEKYAAKQGEKLLKKEFQTSSRSSTLTATNSALTSGLAEETAIKQQSSKLAPNSAVHPSGQQSEITNAETTAATVRVPDKKAKKASEMKKAANKEKHAALRAKRAAKKDKKLASKAKQAALNAQRIAKKTKGAKREKIAREKAKRVEKRTAGPRV